MSVSRFIVGGGWPEKVQVEVEHKPKTTAIYIAAIVGSIPTSFWVLLKIRGWLHHFDGPGSISPFWDRIGWILLCVEVFLICVAFWIKRTENPKKKIVKRNDPKHPPYDPKNLY